MKLTWRLSFSTFRMDRKQVQCLDCGKKLSSRDRLKQHMATQHWDNPPTFTCQCGKVFKSQRGLKSPCLLNFSIARSFCCRQCRRSLIVPDISAWNFSRASRSGGTIGDRMLPVKVYCMYAWSRMWLMWSSCSIWTWCMHCCSCSVGGSSLHFFTQTVNIPTMLGQSLFQ